MHKFILILAIAFWGDSLKEDASFEKVESMPIIVFSSPAIDFESGQPVFSKDTDATLNKFESDEVRIFINDSVDIYTDSDAVELSDLINFSEGTYTVLVQGKNYEEVFGFTIR